MPHKDPEAARAYHRAYAQKHREHLAQRAHARYLKNRKQRQEYMKQWYLLHPESLTKSRLKRRLKYPWYQLIIAAKHRAAKKRVPFLLTQEWGRSTWTGVCEITGIAFVQNGLGSGPKPRSPTIDRIDPKKGYVPDNCRFILACVNSFKHEGTEAEMMEVAEAIVRKRLL